LSLEAKMVHIYLSGELLDYLQGVAVSLILKYVDALV